jgi:hypothetical protein
MVVVLSGIMRFASGELARKDEVHQRETARLTELIKRERKVVNSLKTELKQIKEKKKIVRTKSPDGSETETIVSETDTSSDTKEAVATITELEFKLREKETELDYVRKTSTPIGQVGFGVDPFRSRWYVRAGYAVFGPIGVEGMSIVNPQDQTSDWLLGLNWTF